MHYEWMGFWSHFFTLSIGASAGFVLFGIMSAGSRASREEERFEQLHANHK